LIARTTASNLQPNQAVLLQFQNTSRKDLGYNSPRGEGVSSQVPWRGHVLRPRSPSTPFKIGSNDVHPTQPQIPNTTTQRPTPSEFGPNNTHRESSVYGLDRRTDLRSPWVTPLGCCFSASPQGWSSLFTALLKSSS
jgi:hypothetical protein